MTTERFELLCMLGSVLLGIVLYLFDRSLQLAPFVGMLLAGCIGVWFVSVAAPVWRTLSCGLALFLCMFLAMRLLGQWCVLC